MKSPSHWTTKEVPPEHFGGGGFKEVGCISFPMLYYVKYVLVHAHQGCILSPCLFNLWAKYIMRNARLDELQTGIKIASRNINNPRYSDDTSLMAESEEELKNLLINVKGN